MKIIIIILLLNLSIALNAQNNYNSSIKISTNYIYHFIGANNSFNYELLIAYGILINNHEIDLGVSYSTKNYFFMTNPSQTWNNLIKREYRLSYLNFPFVVYFNLFKKDNLQLNLSNGIVFNKVITYSIKSYYENTPSIEEDISDHGNLGVSIRLGIGLSKTIGKDFILYLGPFADFKIVSNNQNENNTYNDLPDNKLTIGFNLSIEYLF